MAGSRRTQRSVRITVATTFLLGAVLVVGVAVASSDLVAPAAVLAVVGGAAATRIMYAEVVRTRLDAARQRAEHARSFQATMDRHHEDHRAHTVLMARRLGDRDRAIGELGGTLRLLERRVDDAESRVRREARRANEAQVRLAAVLDEVLGTGDADLEADLADGVLAERRDLPTVVDLLGWDARANAAQADQSAADTATVA